LERLRQQDHANRRARASECAEFVAWGTERGIPTAVEKVHNIQNPMYKQLLALARTTAK
jgi:hypothetical protein